MYRHYSQHIRTVIILMAMMMALFGWRVGFAQQASYSIGVVPQFSPLTIHRSWRPFLDKLGLAMGVNFNLKVYPDFKQFLADVRAGEVDFVFLAPFHAVIGRKEQGYIPLIRDDDSQLVGMLVVRKDSPFTTVKDLDGKRISFPSPNAFAASVYLRAYLTEKEKVVFIPRYVGTHDNVYRHVLVKLSSAGGGVNKTLVRQPANLKDQLRVLYELPGVPAHPISAHPRVPEEMREKFITAILAMHAKHSDNSELSKIQFRSPVRASYARDYQFLEALNLEKYMD